MNFTVDFVIFSLSGFFPFFLLRSLSVQHLSPPRDFSLSIDMENLNIQPEDVRVPSADSSPTQVLPEDSPSNPDPMTVSNHSDTQALDPASLPSLPRSENQYNEDYTDYARQVHNPAHGSWPVAEPFEEWACRRSGQNRYWFYRAWFHHQTLFWDHMDLEYYKSATGYFIDTHPASHWPMTHSRVWGTRGWQLVLSATQSLSMWEQCERFEAELRAEEERLAAAHNPTNIPVHRRGQKRQAVDNLEHLNVQYQIESLLRNFSQMDVSQVPMLQSLAAPEQNQLIGGVVHTLTSYQDELQQALRPHDPDRSTAASSAPAGQTSLTDPVTSGTGLPLPPPDSGSMSLNSSSTNTQPTLDPPFPAERAHD